MAQMIIANRLRDGRVVFMTAEGAWVESIDDGLLIDDAAESGRMLDIGMRGERNCEIIDPCLIEVTEQDGVRTPTAYREEIRATGPTVRTEELN